MERRAICRAGEEHAKYRCESINTDEAVLKKAYAENPSVLKFLEISRDWDYGKVPPTTLTTLGQTAPSRLVLRGPGGKLWPDWWAT